MHYLKIILDNNTYQKLKQKFNGDEKAMCDFTTDALTEKLLKFIPDKSEPSSDINKKGLEDYLKTGKSGSRSYGTKGQGW